MPRLLEGNECELNNNGFISINVNLQQIIEIRKKFNMSQKTNVPSH